MSTGVYAKTAGDLIRDALRAATISGISLPVQSEDFCARRISVKRYSNELANRTDPRLGANRSIDPLEPRSNQVRVWYRSRISQITLTPLQTRRLQQLRR